MKHTIVLVFYFFCVHLCTHAQNIGFLLEGKCYNSTFEEGLAPEDVAVSFLNRMKNQKLDELSSFKLLFSTSLGYAIEAKSVYTGDEKRTGFSFGQGNSFMFKGSFYDEDSLKEFDDDNTALTTILVTIGGNLEFIIRNFVKDKNYERSIVEGEDLVISHDDEEYIIKTYDGVIFSHYSVMRDHDLLFSWQAMKDEEGFADGMKIMFTKEVLASNPEISEAELEEEVDEHLSSKYYRARLLEFRKFHENDLGLNKVCVYKKFDQIVASRFQKEFKIITDE